MLSESDWTAEFLVALSRIEGKTFFELVTDTDQRENNTALRASSIGECARKQYYRLKNTLVTNVTPSNSWATLMGYAGQAIVVQALKNMGYTFLSEEETIEYSGIRGHMDGLITGHDLGDEIVVWDSKIRSAFGYRHFLRGIENDPTTMAQQQTYMAAKGVKHGMVTVLPFDLATNGSLMRQYKMEGEPAVQRIILEPEGHEEISERATSLQFCVENDIVPMREFDPDDSKPFPCPYCPWREMCRAEGEKGFMVSELPWKET